MFIDTFADVMCRLHPHVSLYTFSVVSIVPNANINIHKPLAISICHVEFGQKNNCFSSDFMRLQYISLFSIQSLFEILSLFIQPFP